MMPTYQEQQHERDTFWDATIGIWRTTELVRQLLGWECFLSWEAYQKKYGAQEYGLGSGQSFTTPTPVAFGARDGDKWEIRVFSPDHEELTFFKPQESFDDAWQLLEGFAKQQELPGVYLRDDFAGWEASKLLNAIWDAVTLREHGQKYDALRKRLDRAEALLEKAQDDMALESRKGSLYTEINDY